MDELPPLVARANALARQLGFPLTRQEVLREDGQAAPHEPGAADEADGRSPGSPSASLPGVGRFLAVLAAGCRGGRIDEIGTGVGVGSAWMAGAMPADCTLVTVELDARRAAAAAQLLAFDRRIRVLKGDARQLLPPCGPFDLLFADGGWRDDEGLGGLVDLLLVGGKVVMDDVMPIAAVTAGTRPPGDDIKREFFFGDRRLMSTEVVLPDLRNSLLVGTRLA